MTPEWEKRLDRAHSHGLQRLLSFETRSGGFGWYAGHRANTILSAYAAMYLTELAQVYEYDSVILDRTLRWLEKNQDSRGRWTGSERHRTWQRLSDSAIPSTAYVAWALRLAGREDSVAYQKAAAFLDRADTADPYAFALIANARPTAENLDALAKLSRDGRWTTQLSTWNAAAAGAADVETTALAVIVLARHNPRLADEAASWLVKRRSRHGAWGSTQATVLALKALAAVGGGAAGRKVDVKVLVNGREVARDTVEDGIEYRTFDISPHVKTGANVITLETTARVNAQVTGRYYVPWGTEDLIRGDDTLNLHVTYDRTEAKVGETVTCTVKVEADAFMVLAEVAVPPGFTVDRGALDALVAKGTVDKVTQTGRTLTFYLQGKNVEFSYALKPRYPVEVSVPRSVAYEYYTPDRRVISPPQSMTIR